MNEVQTRRIIKQEMQKITKKFPWLMFVEEDKNYFLKLVPTYGQLQSVGYYLKSTDMSESVDSPIFISYYSSYNTITVNTVLEKDFNNIYENQKAFENAVYSKMEGFIGNLDNWGGDAVDVPVFGYATVFKYTGWFLKLIEKHIFTKKKPNYAKCIVPEQHGKFIMWKYVWRLSEHRNKRALLKLEVPANAKVIQTLGSNSEMKIRVSQAKVLAAYEYDEIKDMAKSDKIVYKAQQLDNDDDDHSVEKIASIYYNSIQESDLIPIDTKVFVANHDNSFKYTVGKTVKVDNFDNDPFNTCSAGIHGFLLPGQVFYYIR